MKNKLKVLLFIMLISNFVVFAQSGNPDDPTSQDPGTVPANDFLWVLILIGLIFGSIIIRKRSMQKSR